MKILDLGVKNINEILAPTNYKSKASIRFNPKSKPDIKKNIQKQKPSVPPKLPEPPLATPPDKIEPPEPPIATPGSIALQKPEELPALNYSTGIGGAANNVGQLPQVSVVKPNQQTEIPPDVDPIITDPEIFQQAQPNTVEPPWEVKPEKPNTKGSPVEPVPVINPSEFPNLPPGQNPNLNPSDTDPIQWPEPPQKFELEPDTGDFTPDTDLPPDFSPPLEQPPIGPLTRPPMEPTPFFNPNIDPVPEYPLEIPEPKPNTQEIPPNPIRFSPSSPPAPDPRPLVPQPPLVPPVPNFVPGKEDNPAAVPPEIEPGEIKVPQPVKPLVPEVPDWWKKPEIVLPKPVNPLPTEPLRIKPEEEEPTKIEPLPDIPKIEPSKIDDQPVELPPAEEPEIEIEPEKPEKTKYKPDTPDWWYDRPEIPDPRQEPADPDITIIEPEPVEAPIEFPEEPDIEQDPEETPLEEPPAEETPGEEDIPDDDKDWFKWYKELYPTKPAEEPDYFPNTKPAEEPDYTEIPEPETEPGELPGTGTSIPFSPPMPDTEEVPAAAEYQLNNDTVINAEQPDAAPMPQTASNTAALAAMGIASALVATQLEPGELLQGISKRLNLSLEDLKNLNPNYNSSKGGKILLPAQAAIEADYKSVEKVSHIAEYEIDKLKEIASKTQNEVKRKSILNLVSQIELEQLEPVKKAVNGQNIEGNLRFVSTRIKQLTANFINEFTGSTKSDNVIYNNFKKTVGKNNPSFSKVINNADYNKILQFNKNGITATSEKELSRIAKYYGTTVNNLKKLGLIGKRLSGPALGVALELAFATEVNAGEDNYLQMRDINQITSVLNNPNLSKEQKQRVIDGMFGENASWQWTTDDPELRKRQRNQKIKPTPTPVPTGSTGSGTGVSNVIPQQDNDWQPPEDQNFDTEQNDVDFDYNKTIPILQGNQITQGSNILNLNVVDLLAGPYKQEDLEYLIDNTDDYLDELDEKIVTLGNKLGVKKGDKYPEELQKLIDLQDNINDKLDEVSSWVKLLPTSRREAYKNYYSLILDLKDNEETLTDFRPTTPGIVRVKAQTINKLQQANKNGNKQQLIDQIDDRAQQITSQLPEATTQTLQLTNLNFDMGHQIYNETKQALADTYTEYFDLMSKNKLTDSMKDVYNKFIDKLKNRIMSVSNYIFKSEQTINSTAVQYNSESFKTKLLELKKIINDPESKERFREKEGTVFIEMLEAQYGLTGTNALKAIYKQESMEGKALKGDYDPKTGQYMSTGGMHVWKAGGFAEYMRLNPNVKITWEEFKQDNFFSTETGAWYFNQLLKQTKREQSSNNWEKDNKIDFYDINGEFYGSLDTKGVPKELVLTAIRYNGGPDNVMSKTGKAKLTTTKEDVKPNQGVYNYAKQFINNVLVFKNK